LTREPKEGGAARREAKPEGASDSELVLNVTERLARAVSVATTRRAFFHNMLRGTFTIFASSALVGWVFAEQAEAAICFPSPPCPSGVCGGSYQNVCLSVGGTCKNTGYGHTPCNTTYPGCWYPGWPWLCCDCCCSHATGAACTSRGCEAYKKCICQVHV